MIPNLPALVDEYVRATNNHDPAGFLALFADDAIVDDAGREMRGLDAIRSWSDHEIFKAKVTLEVLDAKDLDGETALTVKVDGSFDRTGLPDPLIMIHTLKGIDNKLVRLTCRLQGEGSRG